MFKNIYRYINQKETCIFIALITGVMIASINSSMIAVALSPISTFYDISISTTIWVVTIYLIGMACFQPIAGKLGDIFGYRNLYLIGVVLFIIASLGCALSPSFFVLLFFRLIQAIGGSLLVPNSIAIIKNLIPQDQLSKALGMYSLIAGLGSAAGPLISAILISTWEWTSIFFFNIPLLLFSFVISFALIPKLEELKVPSKVDYLGSLWLAICIGSIVIIPNTHFNAGVLLFSLSFLLSLILFIIRENRVKDPIINLKLFSNKSFTRANLSIMLSNFSTYSTIVILPLFMEYVFNITEPTNGLLLSFFIIAMSIASFTGGIFHQTIGGGLTIRLSFIGMLISNLGLVYLTMSESLLGLVIILVLGGFSGGLGLASMQTLSLSSVSKNMAGSASGIYSTFRYFGSILATVLIGIITDFKALFLIFALISTFGIFMMNGSKEQIMKDRK